MKHTLRTLLALAAMLALSVSARAGEKVVSTLSTSAAATVVIAGPNCLWITITNATTANGGAQVNLGLDGGTAWTDPNNGKAGTDPTSGVTGVGQWLAAGSSITLYGPYFRGIPIRAIMSAGTTYLTITTSDNGSTFPTN
jgi:hypothetical protein